MAKVVHLFKSSLTSMWICWLVVCVVRSLEAPKEFPLTVTYMVYSFLALALYSVLILLADAITDR